MSNLRLNPVLFSARFGIMLFLGIIASISYFCYSVYYKNTDVKHFDTITTESPIETSILEEGKKAHQQVMDQLDQAELHALHPSGLVAEGTNFTLGGKPFRIFSGSIHYFRVPQQYWRDRLQKLKDCGLNTVDTYVAWNLHESVEGQFDFSTKNLNLPKFLQLAKELGLYVILRPGPYICAEWEWGGHPSWLLKDPNMTTRSLYAGYTTALERYFAKLLPQVAPYQYTHGGPIIAVQVENEYGSYGEDKAYVTWLWELLKKYGIVELCFTSDGKDELVRGTIPHVFAAVNSQHPMNESLDALKRFQPNRPLMVAEYWAGWFDHWSEKHHIWSLEDYQQNLLQILEAGASFNLYMFHGGTNFGFMNGANLKYDEKNPSKAETYAPTVTSYDYDALLDEAGQPTPKYFLTQKLLTRNVQEQPVNTQVPTATNYGKFKPSGYKTLIEVLDMMQSLTSPTPKFMEYYGQSFGFIAYRKEFTGEDDSVLQIRGKICDRALIIVNGATLKTLYNAEEGKIWSEEIKLPPAKRHDVVILVENMGRVNYVNSYKQRSHLDQQRKGISGKILLDGKEQNDWQIYCLDFSSDFIEKLTIPDRELKQNFTQPVLMRVSAQIAQVAGDTFANMKDWNKGVLFLNGFNLGRFWKQGPQQTLYAPAPLLQTGANEIVVFELQPEVGLSYSVKLQDHEILAETNILSA